MNRATSILTRRALNPPGSDWSMPSCCSIFGSATASVGPDRRSARQDRETQPCGSRRPHRQGAVRWTTDRRAPTYTPGGPRRSRICGSSLPSLAEAARVHDDRYLKLSERAAKAPPTSHASATRFRISTPVTSSPPQARCRNHRRRRYLPESIVGKDISRARLVVRTDNRYRAVRNEPTAHRRSRTSNAEFRGCRYRAGNDAREDQGQPENSKDIVQNGLKRKANAAIASGYSPINPESLRPRPIRAWR